jgi:hypothetical protein
VAWTDPHTDQSWPEDDHTSQQDDHCTRHRVSDAVEEVERPICLVPCQLGDAREQDQ